MRFHLCVLFHIVCLVQNIDMASSALPPQPLQRIGMVCRNDVEFGTGIHLGAAAAGLKSSVHGAGTCLAHLFAENGLGTFRAAVLAVDLLGQDGGTVRLRPQSGCTLTR